MRNLQTAVQLYDHPAGIKWPVQLTTTNGIMSRQWPQHSLTNCKTRELHPDFLGQGAQKSLTPLYPSANKKSSLIGRVNNLCASKDNEIDLEINTRPT